jgi:hypothetical protein
MTTHNGKNGKRPTLLAKILGLGTPVSNKNGQASHMMTSDGVASVDIEKLFTSNGFDSSLNDLKSYLPPATPSNGPTK